MSSKTTSAFLISKRRKRRIKIERKYRKLRPWAYFGAIFSSLVMVSLIFWGAVTYSKYAQNLPSIDLLPLIIEPQNGTELLPTRIFDRDGEVLIYSHQNPNADGSQYIELEQVPEDLIQAILIAIDPEFYSTSYIKLPLEIEISPITDYLVDRFLFENLADIQTSDLIKEMIAIQVEKEFGKDKVLEWYLNSSDFGNMAFGIDRASRIYFEKSLDALELAEISMLAAIIKAPGTNPINSFTLAKQNQQIILDKLIAAEFINEVQAKKAIDKELTILQKSEPTMEIGSEFIKHLLDELLSIVGESQLMFGGIDVISTLDYDLQMAVECTSAIQVERITGAVTPNFLSNPNCDAGRLLPPLGINDLAISEDLSTSIVIIDSKSGEVLAYLGYPLNLEEPGTVISPFIYLTAFTRGSTTATMKWDIQANLPMGVEKHVSPDEEFFGPVSSRTALANDLIAPALQTLSQTGVENVWFTANKSGINNLQFSSGKNPFETIFSEPSVTLLEITHSYSVFSNNGKLAGNEIHQEYIDTPAPILIKTIYSKIPQGNVSAQITTPIVSPEYSYLVTDILSDPVSRLLTWDAGNPLELGFDTAAISSSSSNDDQSFIIGYSSELTIGVWMGYLYNDDLNPEISKYASSGLWHALMRYAHSDAYPEDFLRPQGITNVEVCDPSGMLPTINCPKIVSEIFVEGTEPRYPDTLFRSIQINQLTGLLATVTTPPELIIEKIFMDIPEEAISWAFDTGLEIPPTNYDLTYQGTTQNPDVQINSPLNFEYINGNVEIIGNSIGPIFDSYKLEFGQGISPQEWQQISTTSEGPIYGGVLAIWDTSGLEGLYAIRLQVINSDLSIISHVVQVTIDNQAPYLAINFPNNNEHFDLASTPNIPIQISVSDNISLSHVNFYVDDILISHLTDLPYAATWVPSNGEFLIRISAVDEAGNITSSELNIFVD